MTTRVAMVEFIMSYRWRQIRSIPRPPQSVPPMPQGSPRGRLLLNRVIRLTSAVVWAPRTFRRPLRKQALERIERAAGGHMDLPASVTIKLKLTETIYET